LVLPDYTLEDGHDILALFLLYLIEDFFKMFDALSSFCWNFIVCVPELYLSQNRK